MMEVYCGFSALSLLLFYKLLTYNNISRELIIINKNSNTNIFKNQNQNYIAIIAYISNY